MPCRSQGICIGDPYNHFVTIGLLVGAITTLVSGVLAVLVLNRFRQRGGMHLFMWGIGMLLYFGAGVCETVLAFGWSDLAFRLWYWSGAMLVPPVLAQGTLWLLRKKSPWTAATTAVIGFLALASLVWVLSISLDASQFTPGGDLAKFLTESYRAILPANPPKGDVSVRQLLPPILNIYGTLILAGGAVYSAYLFLRKSIMPNRMLGNVLIAVGGLLPALGGTLIKVAEALPELAAFASAFKYAGIVAGALLLFAGFELAIRR